MAISGTQTRLEHLKRRLEGRLVLDGDRRWDQARGAWNLAVDQRPAAVAFPATAEEVVWLVEAAADTGLRLAPQATGHNPGPLPSLEDAILLKTDLLGDVALDQDAGLARAGGGTVWLDVTEPASRKGLAALAGSSPDVGVAGYMLGGGISWLGRKHGVAANSVTSMTVVTADGAIRQVSQSREVELFWALRGGGGSFGVVAELELRLYPIVDLYGGWLIWPWQRANQVMEAWSEWLASVPDAVTSILRLLRVPSMPVIPGPLRGRDLVVVEAAMLLPEAEAAELLAPLRSLRPEIDTFARMPPVALSHLHMDPDQPVPAMGDSRLIGELASGTIEAILATVGPGTDSPLVAVELRHLGGELARPHPYGGAVTSFDADFMLFGAGTPFDHETGTAIENRLETLFEQVAPWDTGRRYSNFVEGSADTRRFYTAETYRRLTEIKSRLDPDGIFLANHPIPSRVE